MKKFYLILMGVAVLSFATLSCSKEAVDPSQQEQNQKEETAKENPTSEGSSDETPVPEGMIRLTFGVSQEGDAPAADGEDTKTSWDGTTHAWSEGDQIRIIVGEGNVEGKDYVDAEVIDGKVTVDVPDTTYYYAVYPNTATYTFTKDEGKITITIPRYQKGTFSEANIMAAKTSKEAATLNFKNMTSIVKLTTGDTYTYNTIAVMANDQTKLTGTVSTTFPDTFAVETATGSDAILSLQKGNPSGYAGVSANTTYYLAMLPGEKVANGIGFKIEQRASETDLIAGGISKSDFFRERSKVYDLGTLDDRIVKDWYISESGTGVGNIESAPAGPARLMDLLNPSYSTNNTTAGWRLVGATIHVLPGTYNLQKLNGGEVFDPHYNLSNLKVHVKGEGTASNPTKFICNQTAITDHIFTISGAHKVGDFTFENITFTANPEATETNIDGIAFSIPYVTDPAPASGNIVRFKDCTFSGLTGSNGTSDYNGGAAVNINSSMAAKIYFTGCTFSDNTAARGGAFAIRNTSAESEILFTDCSFSNNIANNNQGGSVYVYANASPIVFDHTSFSGDGSTSTADNGGAIAIIKNAKVTLQNSCTFTGCTTAGSGGAIFNHGTLIADGATFSNCKAKLGGAIHTDGAAKIGETAGCTFSNNIATQNGGSIHFQKTNSGADSPTLFVSNTSFNGNGEDTNAVLKGGAIAATSTAYEFTISNCTFSNLVAADGGALHTIGVGTINNGSHFTACDATANGGAIYNGGTLTVDNSTITGKGKSTIMTALLGGGVYNSADANCTIQNNSIIEECALTNGSSHQGAGVWNGGTITFKSSMLRNNSCGYRGGALYCSGTVTVDETIFSGNNAANGGGIHTVAGANCYIKGSTFTGNTATNGAALRTEGASGNVAKLVVLNSLFKDNVPSTKSGNAGGALQVTSSYSYSVIANSTFTGTDGTALSRNGSPYIYILSCTFADNTEDFNSDFNRGWFYNSILASANIPNIDNMKKKQFYSIFGSTRYAGDGTGTPTATVEDLGKKCLGTYSNGVYPLSANATYSEHYNEGMSVTALQELTFSHIDLTDKQKELLAKDQKENDRGDSKIMGAYVLTTAPKE